MTNTSKNLLVDSNNILRRSSNSWNVQATVALSNTYTEIGTTIAGFSGVKISDTGKYLVTVDTSGNYRGHTMTPPFSVSNLVSQGSSVYMPYMPFNTDSIYFDYFNSGNSMYILNGATGILTSTSLSDSYNIRSASSSGIYTAGNTWLKANTTVNVVATISSDGADLLVSDSRANVMHYTLSEPGNLQTAALTYTWTPTLNPGEVISDITFGTDNANVYLTCKPPSNSFDIVIRQYGLSTPKYINTATYISNVVIATNTIPTATSLHFGADNGNAYIYVGSSSSYYHIKRGYMPVYSAIASSVWTDSNTVIRGSSSTRNYHGIALSNTGNTVYLVQAGSGIYAYPLTDSWDINTINTSPLAQSYTDLRYRMTLSRSCSFFNNGKSVITSEAVTTQPIVHKVDLDTGWDIESHIKPTKDTGVLFTKSVMSQNPTSFAVDSTGQNVYVSGDFSIKQFKLTTPFDLSTAYYFADASTYYTLSSLIQKSYDGNTFIYGTESASDRIAQYTLDSNGDIQTISYVGTNTMPYSSTLSNPTFTISSNNEYLYTLGSASGYRPVVRYDYNSSSNVNTYSFSTVNTGRYSFRLDTAYDNWDIESKGMYVTPNGKKLFIKDTFYIHEYSLSTPWEVSTASYVRKVELPINFTGSLFYISPNGRRAHTVSGSTILYITMATPWDITTFIESGAQSKAMSAGSLGSLNPIRGIRMDSSGTRMIIYGNRYLISYSLSDPFNIATSSYLNESYYNASLGTSLVYDFDVSPSGRVIFLPYPTATGIGIRKYISTNPNAWRPNDFYTFLSSTKEIASAPMRAFGFYVDPTGNKAILMDSNTYSIYSYSIGG